MGTHGWNVVMITEIGEKVTGTPKKAKLPALEQNLEISTNHVNLMLPILSVNNESPARDAFSKS
jgi:hypothetical protein